MQQEVMCAGQIRQRPDTRRRANPVLWCIAGLVIWGVVIATGNVQAQDSATGQPRKTWASMMLAGGGVTVAGPSGYCVDPSASHEGKKGAFVLLGSCASLAGSSDRASPQTAAILTATTSPSGAGEATLSGFFPTMARFLQSDAGRKALSRSGQARTVTIQKIASVEDVMYVSVRDTARAPGQDVETDYWRALFSLNGQIVTLSVLSLKTMPLDQTAKRALLERFVARVKSASQS